MTIRSLSTSLIFKFGEFCAPDSGCIQRHQNRPIERGCGRVDQFCYLLLAQDLWQSEVSSRIRRFSDAPRFLEDHDEKESQRAGPLIDGVRRQLALPEQVGLVFTDVFRRKLIRRPFEVAGKIFDGAQICACCTLESNCDARALRASFFEVGSQGPPCDPTILKKEYC